MTEAHKSLPTPPARPDLWRTPLTRNPQTRGEHDSECHVQISLANSLLQPDHNPAC
nr:hypothetical protein GCM10017745_36990 [Saccharothrix mutabilis subsp. capreolus]